MSKQSNDYEIVDFMMDKFKLASGIGKPKHKPPVRRYKYETQKFDMDGYGGKSVVQVFELKSISSLRVFTCL